MLKEIPMLKSQYLNSMPKASLAAASALVIRTWSFIGHCSLVIAHRSRGRAVRGVSSVALPALLLLWSGTWVRGATPAVMPHLDEVASNQSVFVDDANFGRDPFFPNSGRR